MKLLCQVGLAVGAIVNVNGLLHPLKEYSAEICPNGYERDGHVCTREGFTEPIEVCPKGTISNKNQCVFLEGAALDCNGGKLINENWCRVLATLPGQTLCPKGSVPQGNECVVEGALDACPEGTAQINAAECARIEPRNYFCPNGFTSQGDFCAFREIKPPALVCPPQLKFVEGNCVANIERPKECPAGASNEGNKCAYFYPPNVECPPGFEEFDGACIQKSKTHFELVCPHGSTLVGHECKLRQPLPETLVCPEGELVENQCRRHSKKSVSFKCPPNYKMEEGKMGSICVTQVSYDCSHTTYECDPNSERDIKLNVQKKDHLRHLQETKEGEGFIPSVHEKHDYCRKIAVVHPKKCEQESTADPIPFCIEGVFDGHHHCEITDVFPPSLQCEGMVDDKGNCVIDEVTHPFHQCPDGSALDHHHHKCKKTEIVNPTIVCPPDTQLFQGQCARFAEKECPAGGCKSEITVSSAQAVCPVDYTLIGDGRQECVRVTYAAKLSQCPDGFVPVDEQCVKTQPISSIDDEANVRPIPSCPIGFFPRDGQCVSITYQQPQRECPQDYMLENNVCLKPENKVSKCPKSAKHASVGECSITWKLNPLQVNVPVMKSPKEIPQFKAPPLPKMPKIGKLPEIPHADIVKKTVPIDVTKALGIIPKIFGSK